jgi:chromosome segregation ATPase
MRKTMFGLESNYSSIREKFLRVRDSLQAEVAVLAEEKKNLQSSNESLARDNQKMSVDTHKFRVQYMAIEEDMQRSRKERAMLESQHEMLRINFGAEMERFHADNEKLRTSMTKLTEEKSVLQSENEKLRIKVANVPIQPRPHNDSDIRRLVEASRSPVNVAEAAKRESGTAKVSTASTASVPPDEGSLETKLGPTFGSADPIAARSTGPISEVMKPSRWQVLRSSFKQQ